MKKDLLKKYAVLVGRGQDNYERMQRLYQMLHNFMDKHRKLYAEIKKSVLDRRIAENMLDELRDEVLNFIEYQRKRHRKRRSQMQMSTLESSSIHGGSKKTELVPYRVPNKTKSLLQKSDKLMPYQEPSKTKPEALKPYSLEDHIHQMEVFENVMHYRVPSKKKTTRTVQHARALKYLHVYRTDPDKIRADEARDKYNKMMEENIVKLHVGHHKIKSVHKKTLKAINDIEHLNNAIKYLRHMDYSQFKIKPYFKEAQWAKQQKNKEPKAIIQMKSVRQKKRTIIITSGEMDVRNPYILKQISNLMPDMYHYLERPELI